MAARRSVISGSRNSISRDARKAFQIEGIDEILDNVSRVIDGVSGKKAKEVYYEGGKILRDAARRNAPYDPGRKRGTHLRDAIFVDEGPENKPNALVGVRYNPGGAPHAHLVEYGSSRSQAQPYFRPAIVSAGPRIGETIKKGLRKIIEEAPR